MEIPAASLSPEALRGIVEEFITREGTDYGMVEVPLATKIDQVMAQIESGRAVISFDPDSGTCTLLAKD